LNSILTECQRTAVPTSCHTRNSDVLDIIVVLYCSYHL